MYRALLITYYWPPAGGGGVQRWLKFVKYLRDFDIEPIIYTPANPDYPAIDEALRDEIPEGIAEWKYPIWEPYHVYRKFTGKPPDARIYSGFISDDKGESLSHKVSVFIRGNFFIPDARKFWIKPSIKYLTERLRSEPVDVLISTGPPHSMHMIANGVSRRTGIPWIADFRDPWTGIDFYDKLLLTPIANWQHHRMERSVLRNASEVVTVSPYCVNHLEELGSRRVHLITNGFDESDFENDITLSPGFTITHIGSINPDRNPQALWQALDSLLAENEQLRNLFTLKIIGPVDGQVMESIRKHPSLSQRVSVTGWMSHQDAIREMCTSRVLLLLLNDTVHTRGLLPGKLFEYFGANRPILCVGATDGDASKLIMESGTGETAAFTDMSGIRAIVLKYFNSYLSGDLEKTAAQDSILQFSRRQLAGAYAQIIKTIVHQRTSTRK